MSEKRYSTDELVNIFYRTDVMCAMTDEEIKAIIARLRDADDNKAKADALREAAKLLADRANQYRHADDSASFFIGEAIAKTWKAIAGYEEAK